MRTITILLLTLICINFLADEAAAQRKRRVKPVESATEEAQSQYSGPPVVAKVLTGDLLQLKSGERLRLMGVDAPVMPAVDKPGQEPWASDARLYLESQVLDKEVTIKSLGLSADQYGRLIGLVYVGETWLDLALVRQGFAVVQQNPYLDNKTKQQLVEAQRQARIEGLGIWSKTNPMPQPPHEFRAGNGISEGDEDKLNAWKKAKPLPQAEALDPKLLLGGKGENGQPNVPEGLEAAALTLEALYKIQARLSEGVKSIELSRLVSVAVERFEVMASGRVDRTLARDMKDAIDAYRLTLEAFKRKESAPTAEAEKYKKYIDGALKIADASVTSASNRYQALLKQKR